MGSPDEGRSPILSVDRDDAKANRTIGSHAHSEAMLLWSESATLTLSTTDRDWLVPPGYGLWVPAATTHSERALRAGSVHVVRFAAGFGGDGWAAPIGLAIGPLLRELVTHLQSVPLDDPTRVHAEALILELLVPLPSTAIDVAIPTDPRLRIIAERIIADPSDSRDLEFWAREVHAGARTISRLFASETGRTFTQWRTHIRIRAAIRYLADGRSVGEIARALGYRKPSAFISAFRRETGRTPGAYAERSASA